MSAFIPYDPIEKYLKNAHGGRIIVLTGFHAFEYLQEIIKLRAFDYLFKPARIEDITSIIKRAVGEIELSMRKEEEVKSLKIEFKEKVPMLRQKKFYEIRYKYWGS